MSTPAIIGFSGSLSSPSKTRVLVEAAVHKAAHRFSVSAEVYDLAQFGPSVATARSFGDLDDTARYLVDRIVHAKALVVASPVYKGSYPGLFKHLIDLLDPTWLSGKPILLAATGGGDKHALIIEHQLRPLFGFFEAQTLATGVYVSDHDFTEGRLTSPSVLDRLDRAVGQFLPYLDRSSQQERGFSNVSLLRPHQEATATGF